MGRIGITHQDVTKAIAELQGKQKNPTVDNIREVLGTGSKSTIARFLREWKAKRGLHPDDDASIPSELLVFIKGLWNKLQETANNQASQYQEEYEVKRIKLQQELNKANQNQSVLQVKIHQLEEQSHKQNEENKRLNNTFSI